jgi:type IV pilus assembly protein PilA
MFKALKKKMKDQRGLTLIELLAVVVILGIIAAIAVPAIGSLIDNTKKDAHLANAKQMVSAARIALNQNNNVAPALTGGENGFTLAALEDGGYLEELKNPDGAAYDADSKVTITGSNGKFIYSVKLETGSVVHLDGNPSTLTRTNVTN